MVECRLTFASLKNNIHSYKRRHKGNISSNWWCKQSCIKRFSALTSRASQKIDRSRTSKRN